MNSILQMRLVVRAEWKPGIFRSARFWVKPKSMLMSIPVEPKKRGRPATGRDPLVGFRAPPELLTQLEAYAGSEGLKRSEAIRRLVEEALKAKRS